MQNTEQERERQKDDAVVEISLDNTLNNSAIRDSAATSPPSTTTDRKKARKKKGASKKAQSNGDDESDVHSEIEEQEKALRKGQKVKAFEQRELVARAFAGDNVVQVRYYLASSFRSMAPITILAI